VPAAEIGDGGAFRCGPLSLLESTCVYRQFCDACDSDADCLGRPDQVCARDAGGQKICTVRCDPELSGCPWGTAASCGVTDPELGYPTCSHRFGGCRGTGQSCEPCVWDEDCSPNGICLDSSFTGERFCLDLSVSCACEPGSIDSQRGTCSGGGCPPSPSGLALSCLDSPAYEDSVVHKTCYGADVVTDPLSRDTKTGCWPAD
jgi:hypothetical protein